MHTGAKLATLDPHNLLCFTSRYTSPLTATRTRDITLTSHIAKVQYNCVFFCLGFSLAHHTLTVSLSLSQTNARPRVAHTWHGRRRSACPAGYEPFPVGDLSAWCWLPLLSSRRPAASTIASTVFASRTWTPLTRHGHTRYTYQPRTAFARQARADGVCRAWVAPKPLTLREGSADGRCSGPDSAPSSTFLIAGPLPMHRTSDSDRGTHRKASLSRCSASRVPSNTTGQWLDVMDKGWGNCDTYNTQPHTTRLIIPHIPARRRSHLTTPRK